MRCLKSSSHVSQKMRSTPMTDINEQLDAAIDYNAKLAEKQAAKEGEEEVEEEDSSELHAEL